MQLIWIVIFIIGVVYVYYDTYHKLINEYVDKGKYTEIVNLLRFYFGGFYDNKTRFKAAIAYNLSDRNSPKNYLSAIKLYEEITDQLILDNSNPVILSHIMLAMAYSRFNRHDKSLGYINIHFRRIHSDLANVMDVEQLKKYIPENDILDVVEQYIQSDISEYVYVKDILVGYLAVYKYIYKKDIYREIAKAHVNADRIREIYSELAADNIINILKSDSGKSNDNKYDNQKLHDFYNDNKVYYDILELGPSADYDNLIINYRKLIKTWHPDKHHNDKNMYNESVEMTKKLNEAKYTLSQELC